MELSNLPISEIAKIVIPGGIAFISGWVFSHRARDTAYSQEAFHKVYEPILTMINPYKYADNNNTDELQIVLRLVRRIVRENKFLVEDDLESDLTIVINRIKDGRSSDKLFDLICLSIENKYRKLKRNLGYPVQWGIFYFIENSSHRRFKARMKKFDHFFAQIIFIILALFMLIITSQFLYNRFVDVFNWVISLQLNYNQ